jgi:3-(3-hydroxy-phenyl)propionate hydroxylase
MTVPTCPVAIVGAGPTGLALGRLLTQLGIEVAVFERSREAVRIPRATHIDDEVVRIFQALGVAHELEPTMSLPPTYEFFDKDWNKFLEFPLTDEIGDQGWCGDYMFHQPAFEARLRAMLADDPLATVRYGWTVTDIDDRGDIVNIRAVPVDGGAEIEVTAAFVVGADGARSTVRHAMGTGLEDLHGTQRWLITDVLLNEGVDDVAGTLFSYCPPLPGRAVTYVTTGDRRRRVEFKVKPDDDWHAMETPEAAWQLLEPYITRDQALLERADVYQFNALLADRWRVGRLLLAGDSAHQMPPKAGQGLCSGFRDAINLAWKLAHVIRTPDADGLLDTYQIERKPHARHWIEVSNGLAQSIDDMNSGNASSAPAEPTDEQAGPPPRPALGPGIHEGFLYGGELSAQCVGDSRQFIDDVVGYRWTIIAETDFLAAQHQEARDVWQALGAKVLSPAEANYEAWLEQREVRAVVIRPDRYLLGAAAGTDDMQRMADRLAQVLCLAPGKPSGQQVGHG